MRRNCALLLVFSICYFAAAIAQDTIPSAVTPLNNTGKLPYSTSVGTDVEQVELASGNLIVNIPFLQVPGRKMTYNFGVRYDARVWTMTPVPGKPGFLYYNPEMRNWLTSSTLGWTTMQGYLTYSYGKSSCPLGKTGVGGNQGDGYTFTDGGGLKHSFLVNQFRSGECGGVSGFDASNYVGPDSAMDGLYASFLVPTPSPSSIEGPDGTVYHPGGSSGGASQPSSGLYFADMTVETDPRGNSQNLSAGQLDSIGRTLVNQSGTNPITYAVVDSNSKTQNYVVTLETITVTTAFGTAQTNEYTGSRQVISSILLPDGQSYSFQYDSWGNISSLTLPTGAIINYTWTTVAFPGGVGSVRAVQQRSVVHGGQTDTWTFSYNALQDYGSAVYNISVLDPADIQGQQHQTNYWYDTNQHLLRAQYLASAGGTTALQYDLTWDPTADPRGHPNSLLTAIQTTQDGLVSLKTFQYDIYAYPYQVYNCEGSRTAGCWSLAAGYTDAPPNYFAPLAWQQGSHGNVTTIREYAWGQGTPGGLLRQTIRTYLQASDPTYFVATPKTTGLSVGALPVVDMVNRVASETLYDGSAVCSGTGTWAGDGNGTIAPPATCAANRVSQTSVVYDNGAPATYGHYGEATSIARWLNLPTSTSLTTGYSYDSYGNIISETDPRGNTTTYGYADTWSGPSCTVATPTNAYLTSVINALGQESIDSYFECTGKTASHQDPNDIASGRQGTTYLYDELGRPASTTFADGGNTTTTYNDAVPSVDVQELITSGQTREVLTLLDSLGRKMQTQLVSDPQGKDITDTKYDALGRVQSVSNPYRSTTESTYGTTTYYYDTLGRKTVQGQSDGSFLEWCYDGLASTLPSGVTSNCSAHLGSANLGTWVNYSDESGNRWQRTSDALGRLTQVLEPNGLSQTPSLESDYSYNLLDDLLSVNQKGVSPETGRTRSFTYDSLSRLLTSSNPESGVIGYAYDAGGNVLTKTDGRNITETYAYDALNRLTSKQATGINYAYYYDRSPGGIGGLFIAKNPIGRLVESSNGLINASEQYSYDPMGRVAIQQNCLPSLCEGNYIFALYDLAGDLTSLTYPDGRLVKQSWDAAGHLNATPSTPYAVSFDSLGSAPVGYKYLSSATYFPNGSVQSMNLGNGVVETYSANKRLQPTEIKMTTTLGGVNEPVYDKQYCYGPAVSGVCTSMGSGKDNGNIWAIPDVLNSSASHAFTYDSLNRISMFANGYTNMSQTYGYDSFGNMNQKAPGTLQTNLTFNAKNQVSNTGYGYDAAGNLTQIPLPSSGYQNFVYDAESKLTGVNAGAATYSYDAEGDRIRKDLSGGSWTEYVYFNGQPLAEKNSDGSWSDYIYANGRKIAQADTFDRRLWTSGTTVTTGHDATWNFPPPNYTIRQGDKICWRQYQDGVARGGVGLFFTDGSNTNTDSVVDSDGHIMHADSTMNAWHVRTVDLSNPNSNFTGRTINRAEVVTDWETPVGNWDIWYDDLVIVSLDGTVIPLYHREPSVSLSYYSNGGMSNTSASVQVSNTGADTEQGLNTTTYYHGDQVGSARMLTAAEGWPVSTETYYPFGPEQVVAADPNHYKFTGKERDTESGNDYFGARYYASSMGRFMSPDWSKRPEAVPYSDLNNPQSLNLYGYVNNNPLRRADPDGHFWHELWNAFWWGTWTKDTALAKANYNKAEFDEWVKAGRPTKVTVGIVYWIGPVGGAAGATSATEGAAPTDDTPTGNGDTDPSTPIGRRGNPIDVKPGTNSPETINGRQFTGHALDQMQGRGIPSSVVEDTISNGTPGPGNQPGTATHTNISNGLQVVTNSSGDVVTVKTVPTK